MKVTIFQDVFKKDKEHAHVIQIATALKRIKEGKSQTIIEAVRNGSKDFKKKLPVVLFSGEFEARNDEALTKHSQFIVLDFDHIDVDRLEDGKELDVLGRIGDEIHRR